MCEYALDHGWKSYRGHQIFQWLYRNRVFDIDEMSNVSKETREILKKDFIVNPLELIKKQVSHDGTTKFLFKTSDGALLESVMMVFDYGRSVCVSSQVGCNMGCAFCASGLTKKKRDLTSGEMVAQVMYVQKELDKDNLRLSHIVVMGTGEPFDNYDNVMNFLATVNHDRGLGIGSRHITISTCGIVPRIYDFANEHTQYNLAISLHAPNDELRDILVPLNKKYPIAEVLSSVRNYLDKSNANCGRVTIEYVLLDGINDSPKHALELCKLLAHTPCKINLIPFNPHEASEYRRPSLKAIERFQQILIEKGFTVLKRSTRGDDIAAACGQLAGQVKDRLLKEKIPSKSN